MASVNKVLKDYTSEAHKKPFQRTPNTPRLSGHAFGIVAHKAAPYSVPLNQALAVKWSESDECEGFPERMSFLSL